MKNILGSASCVFGPAAAPEKAGAIPKLIRSKAAKRFFARDGTWTDRIERAARFLHQWDAQAVVNHYKLKEVELYYLFGEREQPMYDFTVPIWYRSCPSTSVS